MVFRRTKAVPVLALPTPQRPALHHLAVHMLTISTKHVTGTAHQPDPPTRPAAFVSLPSSRTIRFSDGEQCAEALLGRRRSNRAAALCGRQSRAPAGGLTAEPSGCRAPRALPMGTRFGVQRAVGSSWWPAVRMPVVALVALSAFSVSVHASG